MGDKVAELLKRDARLVDGAAFFEVKQVASLVYDFWYSSALAGMHIPGHDFTPEEKRALSVLVIRPQDSGRLTNFFGGQWQAVTAPFGDTQDFSRLTRLPLVGRRFASHAAQPQMERYQVQIFRRPSPPDGLGTSLTAPAPLTNSGKP